MLDYNIKPFRFWCQKVLPLVYDDSLSYMETLCKVVDYLNHVIEDINGIPNYINELISDDKLKEIISELFDELREQIARANEGENTTASFNRDVDELVWLNGKLVRMTRAILAGDRYIEDNGTPDVTGNFVYTSVELELQRVKTSLTIEITAREQADTQLQTNINNEVLARQEADTQLQTNIDNEVLARQEADTQLQTNIDNEATTRRENDDALATLIGYNDRYINVKKYNATGDGTTDDTNAIVNAINAAVTAHKPVYFPSGVYRITQTINIPEGITLIGTVTDFSEWDDNNELFSTILIDTTIDENVPAFTCHYGITMQYLKFIWKENVSGITPKNYGPLVSSTADTHGTNIMADCTFKDLLLENASRGFYAKTGGRNIFKNIKADVSEYFVNFDEQRDSDYFDTIHIFPFASTTDTVRTNYVFDNCNAFIFTNCDDMHLSNILILKTRRGLLMQADSTSSPNDYGAWVECVNVSFDGTKEECVYMAFPKYASFTNCRFVGTAGYKSCVFVAAQTQSKVLIDNSSFWFADCGVINHGARLLLSNCTCEGNVQCIVQENSINSGTKISNCEMYGNDYYQLPGNAEIDGEKLIDGTSTSYSNLVASDINAVQVSIPITYQLSILEFKTPDNGYGVIKINSDGTNSAQTIKFRCNGEYVHIPLISKLFLTTPNVQIIYQPTSITGGSITDIKVYKMTGKCDAIINEYKRHASSAPAYICSDYSYDDNGYHAVDMTNESLTAGLFKDGSTLLGATRELIVVNGSFKQFLYDT